MYCPEHLIFKSKSEKLWVWFYDIADIRWEFIPLKRKLNLLRYEVSIHVNGRRFAMNEEGAWARKFSNAIYRIKTVLRMSA